MNVYWLEQTEADVPAENDWLSPGEVACLEGMRFPKRRADWRLGRWTAKRALAVCLQAPPHPGVLAKIEIRAAPSGAPEAFFAGKPAAVTISLSHRAGTAMCAVGLSGVDLGCDVEVIESRSDAFVADYFTANEQALIARSPATDRSRLLALLWSGKESTLKALHMGLRVDTRCLIVSPVEPSFDLNGWSPIRVRYDDGRVFHGWWQRTENTLRTLVADPAPDSPIPLQVPAYFPSRAAQCA